jgi:hypothetical protein
MVIFHQLLVLFFHFMLCACSNPGLLWFGRSENQASTSRFFVLRAEATSMSISIHPFSYHGMKD